MNADMDAEPPFPSTVTLRVHRFLPRPDRDRGRSSSPFGARRSPFGASSSPSRRRHGRQWTEDFTIAARPEDTVLDCLQLIRRTIDPTLAFRYSCGHGMCGSDAVSINGSPTLLCTATVGDWTKAAHEDGGFRRTGADPGSGEAATAIIDTTDATDAADGGRAKATDAAEGARTSATDVTDGTRSPDQADDGAFAQPPVIEVGPLPGFPVIRDLVVDIDPMFDQIRRLDPHLVGADDPSTESRTAAHEYLQTPAQLRRYELLSDCIACGVCEGSCPVYAGGEAFVGPAALVAASRFINDSRDTLTEGRLDAIDTQDGVAACQSVRACSRECPRGIDVGEEIWRLVAKVKERQA
ncbi:2Fe-2S iron-sulfur cluster-binding protein [uncultured Bifidobacterium sp.]|uniref:succinate dehydrogenase/fumarate reductase iron-sulfur subunit n=1 Tax=uncultured Bifidobacterium sp. TaxID=165187 RepID=UPI0028DC092C|nr:2Fe-2S iron-sulfur cluster-binding protein [uncultured Bifidobacterium sp.]